MLRGKYLAQQREGNNLQRQIILKWITLLGVRRWMKTIKWPPISKQIICSEICRPRSSSTEFKSGINTKFGDDLKRRDQYKLGVVEG